MSVPGKKAGYIGASEAPGDSEGMGKLICQPCNEEGNDLPAAGFCVDCSEYLCDVCFTTHRRARPCRNHILQDLTMMPRRKHLTKTSDIADDECTEHQGETVKFYCGSHDHLVCGTCVAISHRSCDGVIYVETQYEHLNRSLTDIKEDVDIRGKRAEQTGNDVGKYHSNAIQEIRQFRKEINNCLDEIENDVISEVDKVKEEDQVMMTSLSSKLDAMKVEINSTITELDALHNLKRNRKLFATMAKAEEKIQTLENSISQITVDNKIRSYRFEPDKQLKDLLKNAKSIGNISVMDCNKGDVMEPKLRHIPLQTQNKSRQCQLEQTETNRSGQQTQPEPPLDSAIKQSEVTSDCLLKQRNDQQTRNDELRVATYISDIKVQSPGETTCDITGSVLLPGNQLVIADYTNEKIKLVNTEQNKIICEIRLSSEPWDVTKINNSKVAVTLPDKSIIQLVLVGSQSLCADRDIKVNGHCHGIVYNDETLIVTFVDPGKVEIINMNGAVLKTLANDASGTQLFIWPWYIAINPDKTAVYVSDYDKHSVTCMTLDGKVNAVYMDDSLQHPNSLTIDRTGTLYVSGFISGNIHQITADCTKIHILQDQRHRIAEPQTIAYCDEDDKLYVGIRESNVVKTFQLKLDLTDNDI